MRQPRPHFRQHPSPPTPSPRPPSPRVPSPLPLSPSPTRRLPLPPTPNRPGDPRPPEQAALRPPIPMRLAQRRWRPHRSGLRPLGPLAPDHRCCHSPRRAPPQPPAPRLAAIASSFACLASLTAKRTASRPRRFTKGPNALRRGPSGVSNGRLEWFAGDRLDATSGAVTGHADQSYLEPGVRE